MGNIKGNTAAIYSPVSENSLGNSNFQNQNSWAGESFYINDEHLHIENGLVYQHIRGASQNEIWLLSCYAGNADLGLSISFLDEHSSVIYCSRQKFTSQDFHYSSVYGVAPTASRSILVRLTGTGKISEAKLTQLKPIFALVDWEGSLLREQSPDFARKQRIVFKGEARDVRILDSPKRKARVFIGFLENKSILDRVEGEVESATPQLDSGVSGPIRFQCSNVKIPMFDWV